MEQVPMLRHYEYGFLSILLYVWIHLCTSLLSADAFCLTTKAFVSCTFNYLMLRKECLAYGRDPLCDRYTYIYCRFVIFNFIFDPVILFTQNKLFYRTHLSVPYRQYLKLMRNMVKWFAWKIFTLSLFIDYFFCRILPTVCGMGAGHWERKVEREKKV